MYLKSLEISGFKSFGKKSTLDFTSPITAIVGPNGSGKSNVAEAFSFVLGEQSIKSMRGKRGEDLIFNGGKSLSRLNRASVKVTFDNSDKALNIDFDEVTIERVVHRDSANEYFINGTSVRLKNIIELLAGAHIGASGHHIISQGEADKILNANVKERREMIEDALGLKIYYYKRKESERKLEKTEENIKNVESLRREIAPHIKFLGKQVEKIEKAREMRVELEFLYKKYFKHEQGYITTEKERLAREEQEPAAKKKELDEQLKEARDILSKSSQKDQKSENLLALELKLRQAREEKDELTRDVGRLEGRIASEERVLLKEQEMALSEEHKTVQLKDVEEIAENIFKQAAEGENKEDISLLKNILKNIRRVLEDFINKNKSEKTSADVQDSEQEIARLHAEKDALLKALGKVQDTEIMLNKEYVIFTAEIEKEKDSNRDAEKAVFRIIAEQNEVNSVLNALRIQKEQVVYRENQMKNELHEAAMLIGRNVLDFANEEVGAESESQEERKKMIERIKIRLEDSGGAGEEVLKEYEEAKSRDEFLAKEISDLTASAETLRVLIKDLEEKLTIEFKTGVEKINSQFQEFFALMFGGGTAGLHIVKREKRSNKKNIGDDDEEDGVGSMLGNGEDDEDEGESEDGLDISVNLPQKKIKALMMLSGGERALTSIALLFAISQVNPPPFIILDETDAALDEANSRKYGQMVRNLSKYSQLIVITHNRETMSQAGVLYGVTMGSEGFSKLLSIQFDDAVQVAK